MNMRDNKIPQRGDTARVKLIEGPQLLVLNYNKDTGSVQVGWFDNQNVYHTEWFSEELLTLIKDPELLKIKIDSPKPWNYNKLMTDRQFIDFIRDGKKIQAIKYCRELTGSGLKEAKDFVESIQVNTW